MWKPKLNPVTERRLRRFKSIKRSYYSFWILIGLYALSLISEVVSNEKPLVVRSDGEWRFPIFFFYPDDLFTDSGLYTRPDYKLINQLPKFAESEENFMIFPLIPYGPYETISADSIELDDVVYVSVNRKQLVGSLNVDSEMKISRSNAGADFFAVESERDLRSRPVQDGMRFSSEFLSAIDARFANELELASLDEEITTLEGMAVKASLSAFSPRSRPPSSVRITLREEIGDSDPLKWAFRGNGTEPTNRDRFWGELDSEIKSKISASAARVGRERVDDQAFEWEGKTYSVRFDKEIVRFPFRPVGNHYLGLDSSGRDVLTRIFYGLRISLNFGLALVIGTMILGVIIGGLQGYKGGLFDLGGQRLIEIWESLPFLYIMIFMGSVFGRGFILLLIVYGVFNWISISYYIRGEFLKLRKQPFVEAAHCLGLPGWKIMSRHILPNSLVPIITFFPFYLVGAIFSLSALDYLGFGLPPPTPSWGELLSQAQEFRSAWWLVTYPTATLILVILLGVFIGEGVRAAFDPRVNSRFES